MEQSSPKKNSSATAAPSLDLDGNPPNPTVMHLRHSLARWERELADLEATACPPVKMYQKARKQNVQRMKIRIEEVREAIAYELKQTRV